MPPAIESPLFPTRRQFFGSSGFSLGTAALASLLARDSDAAERRETGEGGATGGCHFAPRAKRVIYLFQAGAPSQIELFEHKPKLRQLYKTELPASVRRGQRLTGMSASQASLPIVPARFRLAQHGQCGAWVSELLPYTARAVDDLCFIRSMHTEAINHEPGLALMVTGSQIVGRPSMGAWLSYGLGSASANLPAFVAMISRSEGAGSQPFSSQLWGSGFLPSKYQGVKFNSVGDPVLNLSNPDGLGLRTRRRILDDLARLNQLKFEEVGDAEITTRMAQYEMAYRMQTSVPELTDLSGEPQHVFDLYGPAARKPGTYASNCLLARRLVERGVRFVQLFHEGWDNHLHLPKEIAIQCRETDQASAALVADLKQRGLLDDTLVIWGGEFGRTVYCQGTLTDSDFGRDHHPRCFTIWLAGGGVKGGITFGETDDFSYNITADPVHVHDLQATVLHCLGIDHTRLTFKFQGRHFRLTDVHGKVVEPILAG